MLYQYPADDWDRPRTLLATLGSFWAETYHDRAQIEAVVRAKALIEQQTAQDLLEAAESLARKDLPIYHTDNWRLLTLKASQQTSAEAALARYGDGGRHDDAGNYDRPAARDFFAFPVPEDLVSAPLILNRFTEPSLVWHLGQEFRLEPGRILFLSNPFDDPRVAARPVYSDGEIVDHEAALWIFRGQYDWDAIYRQYAYVLGLRMQSSRGYREVMASLFAALVDGGGSRRNLERVFSAMADIPLVLEPQERVEQLAIDRTHRLIITDAHVYKFPRSSTSLVEVGDVITAGQPLTNALQFFEFNRGEVPEDLRALAIGPGFLANCYWGDLIFENQETPLEVTEAEDHESGFTFVKFGLGGFPADVTRFFDDIHNAGVAASQLPADECAESDLITVLGDECEGLPEQKIRRGTLAHLLDQRANRVGEPTAAVLPATVNPLEFLIANVLRNNAALVKIRLAGRGSQAAGFHALTWLRKIIPPHTALIVAYDAELGSPAVSAGAVSETLSKFTGMEPLADTVTDIAVRESAPSLRLVAGSCQ